MRTWLHFLLSFVLTVTLVGILKSQGVDPGTDNLTHSWTFDDGTANDYVGHANGTLVGGATISGGALVTSAQGQWMEMPAGSIALNTYTGITLEAWYTPNRGSNPNFTMLAFFGNTQNSFGANYYFMTAARLDSVSRTAISCNNTSTPWSAETGVNGPEYDDGKLHHIVSTLTNDSIKLYIDGTLTGAKQLDTNNNISRISRAFAYLAKSGYTGDVQWIGQIQEFNIYNKALDSAEVSFLFHKGVLTLPGPDTVNVWQGPALAAGQYKFLGNVPSEPPENAFSKYWTQLTPGNAGKWASVAGSAADTTKWNWNGLDAQYNYAVKNHLVYKHHTLIWGAQQPSWISSLDSASQYNWIETWIKKVGQRYAKIDMVDVVNEALTGHNPPDGGGSPARANYIKALGGRGTTGWDWVINSFKLARKYMPATTKLLINDYGIINDNSATTNYLAIINLLQQQGLIDGIGVQGHRFELGGGDTTTYKNNLTRLGATGLPVYISEFDLGNTDDTGTADDNFQLQQYKKIFPPLWRHPAVKGITLWGYTEGQMWLPTCYLVHVNGTSRPALSWLAQFVKDNPTGVERTAPGVPSAYQLEQNFPNPFNPSTTIQYSIIHTTNVTLKVFDMLGREVQTLVNTMQAPGQYSVTLNAQGLCSGVYFYQLNAGSFNETKKLMLLK